MSFGTEKWVAYAMVYRERFGLSVIPMGVDKKPMVPWKDYQERLPRIDEIIGWQKENLAIVTGEISNIVVIDCDSKDDYEWFYKAYRPAANAIVRSRRGYHIYYRHPGERVMNGQRIQGRYDVRGDGGYVLAPPSRHADGEYTWLREMLPTDKLPVFDMKLRPPTPTKELAQKDISDGAAYISKIMAISGQGGHDDTYRAVNILRAAGMGESEALLVMLSWNQTNCEPPWSEKELLHKLKSVYGKGGANAA